MRPLLKLLTGGVFMFGVMTNLSLPFYNVTCTANGEDVTQALGLTVLSATVTCVWVMGCVGLRIYNSQVQRVAVLTQQLTTRMANKSGDAEKLYADSIDNMKQANKTRKEALAIRRDAIDKCKEVDALKMQAEQQMVELTSTTQQLKAREQDVMNKLGEVNALKAELIPLLALVDVAKEQLKAVTQDVSKNLNN
jgi:hypothetical protein